MKLIVFNLNNTSTAVPGLKKFVDTLAKYPHIKIAFNDGKTTTLPKTVSAVQKHFKTKFAPHDIFVIGDEHQDILAAKANGYHSAVVKNFNKADKARIQRAAAELDVKDFKDIKTFLVWLNEKADPKGVKKGTYIMPASAIEHVFFSRTGVDEERLKMFRIKKYEDLPSGKI